MRYIKKNTVSSPAASLLNNWCRTRINAGQDTLYVNFDSKEELNDILREEQGEICCYCQKRISHFQRDNREGSHNEHFIPENGEHGSVELQTDYLNIYACCNYSKGREKDKQHCGEAKSEKSIDGFIKQVDCHTFFQYNTLGEILPKGPYQRWSDFELNYQVLTPLQQKAFNTLKILNLNQQELVCERKQIQTSLFKMLNNRTRQQVQAKISVLNTSKPFVPFIDMLLYYMKLTK